MVQVWRPAVVAAHHRAVLEQTPVDTAAEEHQLNQRIAESRLTVCVLSEPAWCLVVVVFFQAGGSMWA